MKIIFTTNNKIGSRFIRWGTDGDCSHVALVFDEDHLGNGIVFHSNSAKGAHPVWLREFVKKSTIVHAIGFEQGIDDELENKIFKSIVTSYTGQGYDDKAFLFWVLMGARKKLFGTPLPQKNQWAVSGYNLCTEMIQHLLGFFPQHFNDPRIDWEMMSPIGAFNFLKNRRGPYDAHEWIKSIEI